MFNIIIYSMVVILAIFSNSVLAEGGAYQLELMIFSQSMPNTETFEQAVSQIRWPSDLTELSSYRKPDTLTLADSYSALSKDSTYQPILHVAWIQQGANAPVHIQSVDGRLNGYVQLQQESGLQLMVDLELASIPGDIIYTLTEKRPVKLNEVYYLDHPKFGVIAKINVF
jgi:hypothetical protein